MRSRLTVLIILLLVLSSSLTPAAAQSPEGNPFAVGNTTFAFDLYEAIQQDQENIIISPYSISQALAMVYLGARGQTEQQMADTLHFILPQEDLHMAFQGTTDFLSPSEDSPYYFETELNIANAIWGQKGYPFRGTYLSDLDQYYQAKLHVADFTNAAEEARLDINDWISEATEERIQDMLPPGSVDPLTRLMLVNAIYLKAGWLYLFSEELTQEETFTLLDGSEVVVDMMRQPQIRDYDYGVGENYQAVHLPYQDQRIGMLIVLPDSGEFAAVEAAMDADLFTEITANMEYVRVNLSMPRFEAETTLSLADTLAAMGMPDAFSTSADFSGIADPVEANEPLMINQVIHQANITVDEQGTEAAAATVVGLGGGGPPPTEPVDFHVDRPFLFTIYDDVNDTILFMGRVLDPSVGMAE